jgi:hypothetical protein
VNSTNSNSGGTAIGTNASSYAPVTTQNGLNYYYCVVSGCGTSSATSTVSGQINIVSCSNTTIPSSGSANVSCGSSTYIYDHAGPSGNYSSSVDGFIVLNNSGNGVITLTGSLDSESGYDFLRIYSGSGTGSTPLFTYSGFGTIPTFTSSPGQIITIRFSSDGSGVASGFSLLATYTGFPVISGISPSTVCSGGNLTINGANFSNISGVSVDNVPVSSFTVNSPTSISATLTASQLGGAVSITSSLCSGITVTGPSVSLYDAPTVTSSGSLASVCTSSSSQSSTFSYTAAANSPTSYTIDWNTRQIRRV